MMKFKRAAKLYFMYCSRVVIILFSTSLCKSAFSTCPFDKTRFSSFWVSVSLAFNFKFFALCFELNVFLKLVPAIFYQIFVFHQMIVLQKL